MKRRKRQKRCNPKRRKTQRLSYSGVLKRVKATRKGKTALARFRRFWGLKKPSSLKILPQLSGMPKVLVGLGRSPAVSIADGPKGRSRRTVRKPHNGTLVTNASGSRMWILMPRARRQKRRFLGYAPKVEYVPHADIEKDGSHKRNKHWVHELGEKGGTWPKLFQDANGNYEFGPASYRITDWIRN